MVRGRYFASLLVMTLLVGASAACSGGSGNNATSPPAAAVKPDDCGLTAFSTAKKPVEITFWNTMTA